MVTPLALSVLVLAAQPPDAALLEARALADGGRLDEAERAVRLRIADTPSSPDAHFLLGYVLFRRTQKGAAAEGAHGAHSEDTRERARASLLAYGAGARYRPLDAFDLKIAALDQLLLDNYTLADNLLTWSVKADARDAEAWYYLGRTKYHENRFEEAIAAFARCLTLDPRNVKAQDNLGLAQAGLGHVEEAIAAYRTAIAWQADRADPDPGPFLDLGSLLLERDQPREALPLLQQAALLSPNDARAHERLGKAHLETGDLDAAVRELEEAVRLAPDSAPTHYVLGRAYRKKGWLDKAKAEFEKVAALQASPKTP